MTDVVALRAKDFEFGNWLQGVLGTMLASSDGTMELVVRAATEPGMYTLSFNRLEKEALDWLREEGGIGIKLVYGLECVHILCQKFGLHTAKPLDQAKKDLPLKKERT